MPDQSQRNSPDLVLLHIGKTGGSALRDVIDTWSERSGDTKTVMLRHRDRLPQVCVDHPHASIGFFVRDPLTRFMSSFYSRQRQGLPRHNSPHSAAEKTAFERYDTVRDLANSLAAGDTEARDAIQAIIHCRKGLVHYLGSAKVLRACQNRIAFIGQTENFDADVARLKSIAQIDADILPPADDTGAHRNPSNLDLGLSPQGHGALRTWLAREYRLYGWCLSHPAATQHVEK